MSTHADKMTAAMLVLIDRLQNHMEIDAESAAAAAGVSTDDEAAIAQAREALTGMSERTEGLRIAKHATIYTDHDGDYVLFCPNINAAMRAGKQAGKSESEVLASIVGVEE